jgi:hypothetical protein
MSQQVLDFDGHVVTHLRVSRVERFHDPACVHWTIEEIRIAKRNVFGAHRHLLVDIVENCLNSHNTELTVVHGNDRTVAASVFTPARGVSCAGNTA